MKYQPEISVIMGVYNCKDWNRLSDSIYSIINQTYDSWELIICDDGSDNGTLDYLKQFSAIDERIRIINNPSNRSLAYSLNKCLTMAKGQYIARQDDYDVSLPDRFEKQVIFLNEHESCGFVGSDAIVFNETDDIGLYGVKKAPTKKDFLWSSPFIHPTVMFRREVLDAVGGYAVASYTKRSQDYDMFMRMYARGIRGANICIPLYKYYDSFENRKKRPLPIRIDECYIRYKGYKEMGILLQGGMFILKPLFVSMIPIGVLNFIKIQQVKKKKHNRNEDL